MALTSLSKRVSSRAVSHTDITTGLKSSWEQKQHWEDSATPEHLSIWERDRVPKPAARFHCGLTSLQPPCLDSWPTTWRYFEVESVASQVMLLSLVLVSPRCLMQQPLPGLRDMAITPVWWRCFCSSFAYPGKTHLIEKTANNSPGPSLCWEGELEEKAPSFAALDEPQKQRALRIPVLPGWSPNGSKSSAGRAVLPAPQSHRGKTRWG